MTHEIRVNVDADMYFRPVRPNGEKRNKVDPYAVCECIKYDLEKYFEVYDANHRFIKVNVKSIPHEVDRDYTDEDVKNHMEGEKKRKTYAEDFFEKHPAAERNENGFPVVSFAEVYGYAEFYKIMNALLYMKNTGFLEGEIGKDIGVWGMLMEDEDGK